MRLVSYLRVSSTGQLDGFGLDVQRENIRKWAKTNGHKIVAEFQDDVTGTLAERVGLADALQALRDAKGLVVARLDRLARDLVVQEQLLAEVWRHGEAFSAAAGEAAYLADDPDDPSRKLIRQVLGAVAEYERAMVVLRLRSGRRRKAELGRHSVGAYAFGLKGQGDGRERDAAPDPVEQAIVARIVELRQAGHTYQSIATTLDNEGLRPRRAASWAPKVVRAIALRSGAPREGQAKSSVQTGG